MNLWPSGYFINKNIRGYKFVLLMLTCQHGHCCSSAWSLSTNSQRGLLPLTGAYHCQQILHEVCRLFPVLLGLIVVVNKTGHRLSQVLLGLIIDRTNFKMNLF